MIDYGDLGQVVEHQVVSGAPRTSCAAAVQVSPQKAEAQPMRTVFCIVLDP